MDIINAFRQDPKGAVIDHYNFNECGQDRKQCQAGFFVVKNETQPLACCSGYFCPAGQICMIPCRPGSYCPSPLQATDGICQTSVTCPVHQPTEFEQYGCGGSVFEGFCPAESYCSNPAVITPCPNSTSYCPAGVVEPLSCLNDFNCINGTAQSDYLFRLIIGLVCSLVVFLIICAKISQSTAMKKRYFGQDEPLISVRVSEYFRKVDPSTRDRPRVQLNIYLYQAKLRDVTRFDPNRNEGFTGQIAAGKITGLMGGSGCGKSSLLDTIHGRRKLHSGSITFAAHDRLSNLLTDYIGYVPQADIMHEDLTVFETVYYSARTRRLDDAKKVIKADVSLVLEMLGLNGMHDSMIKTLSGGKKNHYE